jgi:anti-sigma regulatory factor (Ser/Thr protein kinase)
MHTLRHAEPGSHSGLCGDHAQAAELILTAPRPARAARQFADSTLRSWGISDTGNAVLVTSELTANAARAGLAAGQAEILLRLGATTRYVIIQVGDRNTAVPRRPARWARADADAETGRGLRIARALSRQLCWYSQGSWKIVWAAVPRAGSTWHGLSRRRLQPGRAA